jgi:hypothetical protein
MHRRCIAETQRERQMERVYEEDRGGEIERGR